jgi:pimeloyl-ACP methyl ester carboxylesterase
MAGNGGNGGNGADGGDSRSAQTELNGATDPQAADAQGDCQPGEGGIKGPGGLAGRMHDLSKAPAKAGDPGDDGNSGSVASVETRGSTPTLSEALPCGAKPVVVFIPGFAGSVLKGTGDDGKEVLWPTISPTDMRYFSLSQSGARDVQAVDIIRTVTVGDLVDSDILPLVDLQTDTIYQPLIDFFVNDGFVEFDLEGKPERLTSEYMLTLDPKPTLFPFPYDWRLDNAKNAEKLRWYIDRIRELHPDHDVYIIAHSMGGLIARRCILDNPDGIGKLATMGSPFWGAPVAIYRMLEGEFFGSGAKDILDWVNNDALSKALCTMPGFWQLLPSSTYLANGGLPVIIEDGWDVNEDSYTAGPYTEKQYWDFMDDQAPSTDEPPSDVNREFHSEPQDNWSGDEDQIEYYHVSGNLDEPDTTIGVVAGKTPLTGRTLYIEIKGLGDGTVPLCSAHRFANYRAPDPRTIAIVVTGRYNDVAHMNLPKNDEILSTIMEFFYGLLLLDTAGDYPCVGIWDMGDSQKAPVKAGRE